jgi:hypothetical protein
MSHNNEDEKWILDQLKSKVNGMTINHGDSIDYLGMNFDFKVKDEISVTAKGYSDEVWIVDRLSWKIIDVTLAFISLRKSRIPPRRSSLLLSPRFRL